MESTDHIEELLFDNIPEHIWLGDRNTITQRRRELAQRLAAALAPTEEHELVYVENDTNGYGDGLSDFYRCACGETFQANGDVPEAFHHGQETR